MAISPEEAWNHELFADAMFYLENEIDSALKRESVICRDSINVIVKRPNDIAITIAPNVCKMYQDEGWVTSWSVDYDLDTGQEELRFMFKPLKPQRLHLLTF